MFWPNGLKLSHSLQQFNFAGINPIIAIAHFTYKNSTTKLNAQVYQDENKKKK
jgi:hypothetical protein